LALTANARGGVYIGGGIAPKIMPKLKDDIFTRAFTDKGRFKEFMNTVAVRVIQNNKAALLGAAYWAFNPNP
jgi:glucokinase